MIVVDVETTGLDPKKHSILSIGAVDFSNPSNALYCECAPWLGAKIDQKALSVNGFILDWISIDSPKLQKSLDHAIAEFFDWASSIGDKTLAGMNVDFDRNFLKASSERYNRKWPFGYRVNDLHSLCYSHMLKKGITVPLKDGVSDLWSDRVHAYVGLPEEPKPHNALTGAKMEAEAFSRLIHNRPLLEEFSRYELPKYL